MWRFVELDKNSAEDFSEMTFPRYRDSLGLENITALGATFLGQPAGLVLASTNPHGRVAEVLSLFVASNQRGQGLGTKLLEALEQRLQARHFEEIQARFKAGKPSAPAMERVLAKRGWKIQPGVLAFEARAAEILSAPWSVPIPEGWELFPWGELRNRERWSLLREDPDASWRQMGLHPFRDEESLREETSLGLRANGELIGWMITHQASETTIRYSALYVREKYQKTGRGIFLIKESLRRQVELGIPYCSCLVSPKNEPMKRFMERRLAPYLLSRGDFRNAKKILACPVPTAEASWDLGGSV